MSPLYTNFQSDKKIVISSTIKLLTFTQNEDALINQSEFVYSVHTKIRQVVGAYTPSISIPLLYCKANQINEQLLVS